jgi:homoserine O-acetyltransferase
VLKKEKAFFDFPLRLQSGEILPKFEIAYETYGNKNEKGSNAILICHGLMSDQHVTNNNDSEVVPGWWQSVVGPGLAIDTDQFFVICANALGGFGGSTSPASFDPISMRPYGTDFPVITIADMVSAHCCLADELGIPSFYAIIGGCMGGFKVLEWLCKHPHRVQRAVLLSTSPQVSTHTQAIWHVARKAIQLDPQWNKGRYYGSGDLPHAGLALMANIGALFWMNNKTMEKKFNNLPIHQARPQYTLEPDFEVEVFLDKVGLGAANKIDANSFLYLTRAMDYFDLIREYGSLEKALNRVNGKFLSISYTSDWRYPAAKLEQVHLALEKMGLDTKHKILDSAFGHGAFIYDSKNLCPILSDFLT